VGDLLSVYEEALPASRATVLRLVSIEQARSAVAAAYEGTMAGPQHKSVLQSTAAFLQWLLVRRPLALHNERASLAAAQEFARYHGVELSFRPMSLSMRMAARIRDERFDLTELTTWLAGRVVPSAGRSRRASGKSPFFRPDSPRPLGGLTICVSHAVTRAGQRARSRCRVLVDAATTVVVQRGGQVLTPRPRPGVGTEPPAISISPLDNPANDVLRGQIIERLGRSCLLVVLGDEISAGLGTETFMARRLGLPVVVVQEVEERSPHLSSDGIQILKYGSDVNAARDQLAAWLDQNLYGMYVADRNRRDRDSIFQEQLASLRAAWRRGENGRRQRLARVADCAVLDIDVMLSSSAGLELASSGEVFKVHGALNVPLPYTRIPLRVYDPDELEALQKAATQANLSVEVAIQQAQEMLTVLADVDEQRLRLNGPEMWLEYFAENGVVDPSNFNAD